MEYVSFKDAFVQNLYTNQKVVSGYIVTEWLEALERFGMIESSSCSRCLTDLDKVTGIKNDQIS